MNNVSCNLCGSGDTRFLFKLGNSESDVVECVECGLIYVNSRNDEKFYHKLYSSNYFKNPVGTHMGYLDYLGEKNIHVMNAERRLSLIEKYKQGGKILDVGSATGFFMDVARSRGWEAYGVEISEYACDHAKNKLGLNVFCGELRDAGFKDGLFDVVVMYGTVDHLLDPLGDLHEACRVLKPGGLFVVSIEDLDCFLARLQGRSYTPFKREEHTFFFRKKVMFKMLEKAGFKVVNACDDGIPLPIAYIINRLREYSGMPFASTILDILEYASKKLKLSNMIVNLKYGHINIYAEKVSDDEKAI